MLQKIKRLLRKLGIDDAKFGQGGGPFCVEIWAPEGKNFNCHGAHVIVREQDEDESRADAYRDVYDDLSAGLSDCHAKCPCREGMLA